jgi:hypothetical protein
MLSGDESKGGAGADPMYGDPGMFKLKKTDTFYQPWVDFSNKTILDKMAQFYYDNSRKNQIIDINGDATFQYVYSFKGLISSSQLSCDVQLELLEIKYRPYTGEIKSRVKVPNPVDTGETIDTGCTYHDRRFYFTLDYRKAEPANDIVKILNTDTDEQITNKVNAYINTLHPSNRILAYINMFTVIGCTNSNGTAPNVIDSTPDGEYAGDAPIGLGELGKGYLPPTLVANKQSPSSYLVRQVGGPLFSR